MHLWMLVCFGSVYLLFRAFDAIGQESDFQRRVLLHGASSCAAAAAAAATAFPAAACSSAAATVVFFHS